NRVRGQLRDAAGRPLGGRRVEVLERRMRSERPLGAATTDRDGSFCVDYLHGGADEKHGADIVVRAQDRKGSRAGTLAEAPTIFNAGRAEVVDLMVGGGAWAGPSEYEQVTALVEPRIDGVAPSLLTEGDLAYLAGET